MLQSLRPNPNSWFIFSHKSLNFFLFPVAFCSIFLWQNFLFQQRLFFGFSFFHCTYRLHHSNLKLFQLNELLFAFIEIFNPLRSAQIVSFSKHCENQIKSSIRIPFYFILRILISYSYTENFYCFKRRRKTWNYTENGKKKLARIENQRLTRDTNETILKLKACMEVVQPMERAAIDIERCC